MLECFIQTQKIENKTGYNSSNNCVNDQFINLYFIQWLIYLLVTFKEYWENFTLTNIKSSFRYIASWTSIICII